MRRIITLLIGVILMLLLFSCGLIKHTVDPIGYHRDQVRKHQVRAMEHGAKLDTAKVKHTFKIPALNVNWILNARIERDTAINLISKDSVKTKIVYRDGKIERVETNCPPQTKTEDVPCPDNIELKKPPDDSSGVEWWEVLILVLVFISGMGVMKLFGR